MRPQTWIVLGATVLLAFSVFAALAAFSQAGQPSLLSVSREDRQTHDLAMTVSDSSSPVADGWQWPEPDWLPQLACNRQSCDPHGFDGGHAAMGD